MKILELIKTQCKAQGVDEKYAERIEKISGIIEDKDGNIAAAVKNFKENILPAITEAGKASGDEAQKKAVEEYEKKHGLKDGKPVEPPKKDNDPDLSKLSPEVKAIIESQKNSIEELTKLVSGVVKSQSESQKLATVREKLKGKIDDEFISDYIGQVKLDAEDVDSEVERVVKSYTEMKQKFINKAVADGNYQPAAGGSSVNNDKEIDSYIEQKTKDTHDGDFAGVKV